MLAPRVVPPQVHLEDGGPGSYEDDFEDVEEEQHAKPRARAQSVDYEDEYEDDEEEESWHVDEARLHDAFRMQARQAAPGRGELGDGDRGEWRRGSGGRPTLSGLQEGTANTARGQLSQTDVYRVGQ